MPLPLTHFGDEMLNVDDVPGELIVWVHLWFILLPLPAGNISDGNEFVTENGFRHCRHCRHCRRISNAVICMLCVQLVEALRVK